MNTAALVLGIAGCATAAGPAWTVVETDSPAVPRTSSTLVQAVGIETLGGVFTALLAEGCALPCSTTEDFSTAVDNQESIKISLFRGVGTTIVGEAVGLGQFEVVGIRAAPRGTPRVSVTFEAGDGQVRIAARDGLTGSDYII